jgi:tetratricopeptide (TPR) repeat protein
VTCLGENDILRFVEGDMQGGERDGVEAHVRGCATCQQLLALALAGSARPSSAGPLPSAETLEALFPRGTVLGRYTVLGLLGRGGMGDVYAAYDSQLDRKVALKLLRDRVDDEGGRGEARLLREARAIARLSHRNVIVVHDVGSVGGCVFVAMEYVDGQTLFEWLRAEKRSPADILAVFIEAAHGLAAAHAAGLVHRDFKPQNVMVGADGTVRVTDFGLVRTVGEQLPPVEAAAGIETDVVASLTQTGELVGTPRYMSPEQFDRSSTDARSDQFGYSVALYEALYGEHPFSASGRVAELMSAARAGKIREPPDRSAVAPRLRRVLVRGLSVNPSDRWSSMTELGAALLDNRARARRRAVVTLAVAIGVLSAAIFLGRASNSRSSAVCRGGLPRLAGVWLPRSAETGADPRRVAIAAAFSRSGWADFEQRWDRTAAVLDRFATDWLATYRDACEATQVRGEQSAEGLDARMTCLDQRREALKALTDVLSTADHQTVAAAVDAANALPDLSACANLTLLRAVDPPPPNPADRARVDGLRRRAAVAKAIYDVGKHQQGIDSARDLVMEARQVGHQQLVAELLVMLGTFFVNAEARDEVEATLEEAVWLSLRTHRDDLAAEAASLLTGYVGDYEYRPEEGRRWAALAEALLDRMGGHNQRLRAWLLQGRSLTEVERNVGEALRFTREALALKREILPPDHPDIAFSLTSEAEQLHRMGRNSEANDVARQAVDILVSAYGLDSPHVAQLHSNRAEYLLALGRPHEALTLFQSALVTWQAALGPDVQQVAYPLTGIGRTMLALDRPHEARAPLERALRIRQAHEPRPMELAETSFALAEVLWSEGELSRARALAEAAEGAYAQAPAAAQERRAVTSWLAQHGASVVARRVTKRIRAR